MSLRIGLAGLDSSHAEDFLRHINSEARYGDVRIAAMWGGSHERLAELSAYAPGVAIAASLETLIAGVDAVIVGDRHGGLHAKHALPAITAGRAVFVDKPLANSLADAESMVAAADRAGVPLLSGSALRWQAEAAQLKAQLTGLEGPFDLGAYGTWYPQNEYGGAIFYAIHTVELVQELAGCTWRELTLDDGALPTFRCRIGEFAVSMEFRPLDATGSSSFGVDVTALGLRLHQPIPLGDDYMAPVCEQVIEILRSGRSPLSAEALLAPIRMMAEIEALLGVGA